MAKNKYDDFVYVDIYKALVYVGFNKSKFEKGLTKYDVDYTVDPGDAGECAVIVSDDGSEFFTIFVDEDGFNMGTLVHECVHCAMFILKSRGVGIDYDNHEALTYLTQYLFDKCYEKYSGNK